MQTYEPSVQKEKTTGLVWVTVFLGILVASGVIFASSLEKKWFAVILLGIMAVFACFILQRYLRVLMLAAAVFVIPLRIDFYLIFKQPYFLSSVYPGLPVNSFDILFGMMLLAWLFQVFRGEESFRFYRSVSYPFLAYFVLSTVSAFQSNDYSLSFSAAALVAKSYLVFLFFANIVKTRKDMLIILAGLAAGVWLQSVVGSVQYAGIGVFDGVFGVPEGAVRTQAQGEHLLSRVGGTYGHPNALAKYLGFCLPVLLAYVLTTFKGWCPKLALLTVLTGGFTLLLTLSRGSWIAMAVAISLLMFQVFKGWFRSRLKAIVVLTIVIGVLAGTTIGLFEDVRIRLFESDYRSAQSRIPMALVALDIIKDKPLTGVGLNNYTTVMQRYDHTREWQTYNFPHPVHNSYLLVAAESGIPALVALLWTLAAVAYKARPAIERPTSRWAVYQIGWLAAMITWLVAALFDRDFPGTNVMLWLTAGVLTAIHQKVVAEWDKGKI